MRYLAPILLVATVIGLWQTSSRAAPRQDLPRCVPATETLICQSMGELIKQSRFFVFNGGINEENLEAIFYDNTGKTLATFTWPQVANTGRRFELVDIDAIPQNYAGYVVIRANGAFDIWQMAPTMPTPTSGPSPTPQVRRNALLLPVVAR